MEKPFEFIESKMAHRKEFDITEGLQPTYALLYLKEGSFRLNIDGIDGSETIFEAGDCAIFTDDVFFSRSVLSPISFVFIKFRQNSKCSFTLPLPTGKIFFKNKERFLDDIRAYEALIDTSDARSLYHKEHLLDDILWLWFDEQSEGTVDPKTNLRLATTRWYGAPLNLCARRFPKRSRSATFATQQEAIQARWGSNFAANFPARSGNF